MKWNFRLLPLFGALFLGLFHCVSPSTPPLVTSPAPKVLPAVSFLLAESRQALKAGRMDAARAAAERAYVLQAQAVEVLLLMAELAELEQETEDCLAFSQKAQDQLSAPQSQLGLKIQAISRRCAEKAK